MDHEIAKTGKHEKMKCRRVQKRLSAYQDRELDPLERKQISAHLQSCPYCREQYEKLGRVWQTLGGLEEIRPGPWFYGQLVGKMKEPRVQGLAATLRHVLQIIGAPAIASIILLIGLAAGTYLGSNLARRDLLPSQSAFLASMRVFDPAPPGTLAHGYLMNWGRTRAII